ncbi:MAG: BrnT family toxin [Planctomycetes bacterium]|nr:BrnT family toxin [Planctomycetota bacterium]
MPYHDILWNEEPDGNVKHIAEHGLTPEDVEEVVFNPVAGDESRSSGLPILYGFTSDGRYVLVVYETIDETTIYPVTAYVVEE